MAEHHSPERWEQIKRLYFAASECDGAAREALLTREASDDPELRAQVERLLSSGSAANILEHGLGLLSPDLGDADDDAPEPPLPVLGCYRALRVIGVGGTSTVYEAVQDNPHRTVALKVLRTNLASPSMQQRFEWESRILARLRHPTIAQVYAAGIHEDGAARTPYFVMEHIPGAETITQYANAHGLAWRRRLDIFTRVCDAVQHAHQQGIIHRDLKPGNILVDADGNPKVIDFGVARVVTDETGVSTLHTQPGQIIGTLAYMSPEQCGQKADSLDTRTDIYSLGVVLYELLCNRRPHDVHGLPLLEAVRIIREEPAPRLSSFDPSLRGDLETIVQKAMAKDPERRYSSAAALAEDIEHYLNLEPIAARPPSSVYYIRKLVARHRSVSVLLLLCLVLVAGFGIAMKLQRDDALLARANAETAERHAALNESRASTETERAKEVQALLTDVFRLASPASLEWLQTADTVQEQRPRDFTARELLDRGAERVLGRTDLQPIVRAAVLEAIGTAYAGIGLYEKGVALFEEALATRRGLQGSDHEDVARCLLDLSVATSWLGDLKRAEELCRESIRIMKSQPRVDPIALSDALYPLAGLRFVADDLAESEALAYEALELRRPRLGGNDPSRHNLLSLLALVNWRAHDFAAAERLVWQASRSLHAPKNVEHSDLAQDFEYLSRIYRAEGRLKEAEGTARYALGLAVRTLGPDHPELAINLLGLANIFEDEGRKDAAAEAYGEAVALKRKAFGSNHWQTANALKQLALFQGNSCHRYSEACETMKEALDAYRSSLGPGHRRTLSTMSAYASSLAYAGRLEPAESVAQEAVDLCRKTLGENHPQLANSLRASGDIARVKGDVATARTRLEDAANVLRRISGNHADELGDILYDLAAVTQQSGDERGAESRFLEAFDLIERSRSYEMAGAMLSLGNLLEKQGDDRSAQLQYGEAVKLSRMMDFRTPALREALARFGLVLARNGEDATAEPLLIEVLGMPGDGDESSDRLRARALTGLGMVLVHTSRAAQAEPLLNESLAIHERLHSTDSWQVAELKGTLGRCRSELEDFPAAEQFFVSGLNSMKKTLGLTHPRTRRAYASLIDFYDSWSETEKADGLRKMIPQDESSGDH